MKRTSRFAVSAFRNAELREKGRDSWVGLGGDSSSVIGSGAGLVFVGGARGVTVVAPPSSSVDTATGTNTTGTTNLLATPSPVSSLAVAVSESFNTNTRTNVNANVNFNANANAAVRIVAACVDGSVRLLNVDNTAACLLAPADSDLHSAATAPTLIAANPAAKVVVSARATRLDFLSLDSPSDSLLVRLDTPTQLTSLAFSSCGSLLATTAKDSIVRLYDPRSSQRSSVVIASSLPVHTNIKPSKIFWLASSSSLNHNLVSTGFSRSRDRECALWDARAMKSPVYIHRLDSSSGSLIPLYDPDSSLLFLTGRGDTTIKTFEVTSSTISQTLPNASFVLSKPITNACLLQSKNSLDVMGCEIARIITLCPTGGGTGSAQDSCTIVPVSVSINRQYKMDFQIDLFPDTVDSAVTLSGEKWINGENAPLIKLSLDPKLAPTKSTCDLFVVAKTVPFQAPPIIPVTDSPSPSFGSGSRPASPVISLRRPNSIVLGVPPDSPRVADSQSATAFSTNRPATPLRLSISAAPKSTIPTKTPENNDREESTAKPSSQFFTNANAIIQRQPASPSLSATPTSATSIPPPPTLSTATIDYHASSNLDTVLERLVSLNTRMSRLELVMYQMALKTSTSEATMSEKVAQVQETINRIPVTTPNTDPEIHAPILSSAVTEITHRLDALLEVFATESASRAGYTLSHIDASLAAHHRETVAAIHTAVADSITATARAVVDAVQVSFSKQTVDFAGLLDGAVKEHGEAMYQAALQQQQAAAAALAAAAASKKSGSGKLPNMGITTQLSKLKELALNNISGSLGSTVDASGGEKRASWPVGGSSTGSVRSSVTPESIAATTAEEYKSGVETLMEDGEDVVGAGDVGVFHVDKKVGGGIVEEVAQEVLVWRD
ncbi:Coronin-7 [Physocladia obscura]|uniref:Coronin-7 n=1 Tax=Physocladia obscura TaxID=109957 RepID=A0AAD5XHJ2_9FUNG|nr:Coronin-7 [Physocladia obscura]